MTTTVLIVDDHMIFRAGLRMLLDEETDMQVVGEADGGDAAIELVQTLSPHVVVMDISMPDMDGIEATRRILREAPDTKVVALSIHDDIGHVEGMLRAGAGGYILKESAPEELVEGIQAVANGGAYLSMTVRDVVLQHMNTPTGQPAEVAHVPEEETSDSLVLRTKLHRTRLTSRSVARPRLMALLEEGFDGQFTLISAPAGYGKSTIVSQWLETGGHPSAWLALDESDNDLRRFLTYLIAAIETCFPSLLPRSAALVQATDLPPIRVLVGAVINELAQAPERFILVLDDYHHLSVPTIHEFINELLRHPLPTLHLVVVTRKDPVLDLLQLRAYQQMVELRAEALRFTTDETTAFVQTVFSGADEVEGDVVALLTEKTEGWITGLNLIALLLRDNTDLNQLTNALPAQRQALDYLVAEVLSRQPPHVQDYMLKTSILDRFCAPLCEAVYTEPVYTGPVGTGPAGHSPDAEEPFSFSGEKIITWLTENNLFVMSLDHDGRWFRYHHLFRDLLRDQLRAGVDENELAGLHRRAAAWYAEQDLVEEAIRHALAGGDAPAAAQILERKRLALLQADESDTLARWLALLPDEIRQQRPGLLLAQAHILFRSTRIGEIPPILERLQSLVCDDSQGETEALMSAEISHFQGVVAYFQGDGVGSQGFLSDALSLLPANTDGILRGQFEYWLALAHYLNGRKELAIRELNDGIRVRDVGSGMIRSRLIFGLGFVYMLANQWNQVYQSGVRLRELSQANSLNLVQSWADYLIGYACLQSYDLETARQYLALSVENRYVGNARAGVDAMVGLALSLQFLGETEKADKILERAHEFAEWTSAPGNTEIVRSGEARLALLRGDIDAVERWQRGFSESTSLPPILFFCENTQLTQCRVLITLGRNDQLEEAINKLRVLRTANESTRNVYQTAEILILQAMALFRRRRIDEALQALSEAVVLSTPGGLLRPFLEAGEPMAQLLARLKKQANQGSGSEQEERLLAVEQILAAWPATAMAKTVHPQTGIIEPLTQRELQALRLLATELDPTEIAVGMDVTVMTVRTYCKRIYRKLDVHSRDEAVYRAQELGLI